MEWLAEHMWAVWLVLAGGLAISEMITLDLTLLMLASGALAGGAVAFFFPTLIWAQVLAAVVVAVTMLFLTRPALLKRAKPSPGYRNSTSNLLGSSGLAIAEITPTSGEVKIGGELWTARSYDATIIAPGTEVEVLEMDGITAVVYPRHKPLTA